MHLLDYTPLKKHAAAPKQLLKLTPRTDEGLRHFYDEPHFRQLLRVERMRTERSKKPFLLLLLNISQLTKECFPKDHPDKIKLSLLPSLREIDIRGWYHRHSTIGIIVTEVTPQENAFADVFMQKMQDHFSRQLHPDWLDKIEISYHLFPETDDALISGKTFNTRLYPDMTRRGPGRNMALAAKRIMDILGGIFAILLFAPLFLLIAAAIKATSPGPVFFRQQRVGFNGNLFAMMKFRSMENGCSASDHQNYVKKYICEQQQAATQPGVFKLTHDGRITPIGRFLRQTSLDELPQFFNVLKGDMSLVGPRPPIPYECELYDIWHRRRLFSCMPGITGLWQVSGRSRTTFDDMVRLDLKYVREWSLWLDLKILFRTPKAVFNGSGAL